MVGQLRLEMPQEKGWEDGYGQWIILNVAGSSSFNRLHSALKVLCWIVYVSSIFLVGHGVVGRKGSHWQLGWTPRRGSWHLICRCDYWQRSVYRWLCLTFWVGLCYKSGIWTVLWLRSWFVQHIVCDRFCKRCNIWGYCCCKWCYVWQCIPCQWHCRWFDLIYQFSAVSALLFGYASSGMLSSH